MTFCCWAQAVRCVAIAFLWGGGMMSLAIPALGANAASEALVKEGNAAFKNGDRPGAVKKFTEAIAADGSNVIAYYNRGRIQELLSNFDEAFADYHSLLRVKPDHLQGLFLRGDMYLRTGRFAEAIADYDLSLQLNPRLEVRHWKRGVAYYFAGRYEDGRRQFEKCRTAETNDVENALWHFACVARSAGPAKARAALFSATRDPRLPMIDVLLQLHAVYAGTEKAAELLASTPGLDAAVEKATDRAIAVSFFLGIYYEATGEQNLATDCFGKTARLTKRGQNQGDLARLRVAQAKKAAGNP